MGNNKMKKISQNKPLLIIAVCFVFFCLVSVIYIISSQSNNNNDPSVAYKYIDPGSGETVITTPNKTPEVNGRKNDVIILGSSSFLEVGITDNQLQNLWSYFSNYAASQETPIKEISITTASINRIDTDTNTGINTINFLITVDRKTEQKAKITYYGLNNITLEINDMNNKLIYGSE